jgi:hypothetical protein
VNHLPRLALILLIWITGVPGRVRGLTYKKYTSVRKRGSKLKDHKGRTDDQQTKILCLTGGEM